MPQYKYGQWTLLFLKPKNLGRFLSCTFYQFGNACLYKDYSDELPSHASEQASINTCCNHDVPCINHAVQTREFQNKNHVSTLYP